MIQDLQINKISKNCFNTYSSRLIFALILKNDFCTRNELVKWTGFSSITVSRYLQEFSKFGLVCNAPGIVYLSDLGSNIYEMLDDLFYREIEIVNSIIF
ncbi:MAG: hypothetical protein ACFFDW_01285 [Candidatus Thorarchaeota archaeon]